MPVALNLRRGIDLPVYQWLRFLPVTPAAGACLCNDERGTDRYIYILLGPTSFWRYDTWTDSFLQLANPPAFSFTAGVTLTFDPSRNYIWLSAPLTSSPWHMFAFYDIATNTWTSRAAVSGLTAAFGTDAYLAHTCSAYNSAGNDDHIYLIGNNSTTWYRYSVSGNTWTVMSPALPAAAGVGCALIWTFGFNTDRLYYFQGGWSSAIRFYSISGATFTTVSYVPAFTGFGTGTVYTYDAKNRIYLVLDTTHRILYFQLDTNQMFSGGVIPFFSGTGHVGKALCYVKTPDDAEFLYYRRHSGTEFWRWLIGWY